jgi:hypothetical protein
MHQTTEDGLAIWPMYFVVGLPSRVDALRRNCVCETGSRVKQAAKVAQSIDEPSAGKGSS